MIDSMILEKVDFLFRALKINQIYIIREGKLVGILNKSQYSQFLSGHSRQRDARVAELCRSMLP